MQDETPFNLVLFTATEIEICVICISYRTSKSSLWGKRQWLSANPTLVSVILLSLSPLSSFMTTPSLSAYETHSRFCRALHAVRSLPHAADGSLEPSTADKLSLYGLYKQASQGDCNVPRPSSRHVVEYAKWYRFSSVIYYQNWYLLKRIDNQESMGSNAVRESRGSPETLRWWYHAIAYRGIFFHIQTFFLYSDHP